MNAVGDFLKCLYKPYAGAQFRLALRREGDLQFLTGSVVFCREPVPFREPADYGYLRFVEEWCPEQGEAHGLLSRLLSGQAAIGGHKITRTFNQSRFEHQPYAAGRYELWSGWTLTSYLDLKYERERPAIE